MTSSPQQEGGEPGIAGKAFPLVLQLSLAEGDPMSGTVGVIGVLPAMPFHGWIDLMSAINSLRADIIPRRSPQAGDRQLPNARCKDPAIESTSMGCRSDREEAP